MQSTSLAGKVAIVTGVGGPLGAAVVRLFLQQDAMVVATDVDLSCLDPLRQLPNLVSVAAKSGDQSDADHVTGTAVEHFGRVDILVNNSCIGDEGVPLLETADDLWHRVLEFNLTGALQMSRAAITAMRRADGGVIVNIVRSGSVHEANAGAAFASSQRALVGLTRSIAATHYPLGIRCLALCLGGLPLRATVVAQPEAQPGFQWRDRNLVLDRVAQTILFMASDAASYLNGAVVTADEGWTAH